MKSIRRTVARFPLGAILPQRSGVHPASGEVCRCEVGRGNVPVRRALRIGERLTHLLHQALHPAGPTRRRRVRVIDEVERLDLVSE